VADDALMIDLSQMKAIKIDREGRRAVAAGGATWADLDEAAQAEGLAVPACFISHPGIGGPSLGGGIGWLTAKAGLSCDNIVSAEVVTAAGEIIRADAGSHSDLFLALRGGGGNFGIVTSLEFRLHEVGPMVNLGLFFWGLEDGRKALLRKFPEFQRTIDHQAAAEAGAHIIAGIRSAAQSHRAARPAGSFATWWRRVPSSPHATPAAPWPGPLGSRA